MKSTKAKTNGVKKATVHPLHATRPSKAKTQFYERHFESAERIKVDIHLIDFSPYNKRKFFHQTALEELAENIKLHGVLQDIGVRPLLTGRYELIFGHRRLLAARIAGCKELFVKSAWMPDDVVKEIMFSENVHRENQHPLDEAFLIGLMLEDKKKPEEIALHLGKSKSFVFTRAKLLSLVEPLQELFFYNKVTLPQALLLATLSEDSQHDFFTCHCQGWQQGDFERDHVEYLIRTYQYDLAKAPFDTEAVNLVINVGSCGKCPFNSATLTSLFPEDEGHKICTNKNCFESKCTAHYTQKLKTAFDQLQPQALVLSVGYNDKLKGIIDSLQELKGLPRFDRLEVSAAFAPTAPKKEDYLIEEGSDKPFFDHTGYNDALQEYEHNIEEFTRMTEDGTLQKGLMITSKECSLFYFSKGPLRAMRDKPKVTAKQVQDAIKAGAETPELLEQEMERLTLRDESNQKNVVVKIQEETHRQFFGHVTTLSNTTQFTEADAVATRLLIYQSLTGENRDQVHQTLGFGTNLYGAELLEQLKNLTALESAYVIRMAIAGKSDSKLPGCTTAVCLLALAESAGVDVAKIKEVFRADAAAKSQVTQQRIEQLKQRIAELKNKAA
jgi:ParB/RepB/Spo0J family partition protein